MAKNYFEYWNDHKIIIFQSRENSYIIFSFAVMQFILQVLKSEARQVFCGTQFIYLADISCYLMELAELGQARAIEQNNILNGHIHHGSTSFFFGASTPFFSSIFTQNIKRSFPLHKFTKKSYIVENDITMEMMLG